jgi:hypothetical protein
MYNKRNDSHPTTLDHEQAFVKRLYKKINTLKRTKKKLNIGMKRNDKIVFCLAKFLMQRQKLFSFFCAT